MGGDSWITRLAGLAGAALLTLGPSVAEGSAEGQGSGSGEASLEEQLLRRIEELEQARERYEQAIREQERLAERVEQPAGVASPGELTDYTLSAAGLDLGNPA